MRVRLAMSGSTAGLSTIGLSLSGDARSRVVVAVVEGWRGMRFLHIGAVCFLIPIDGTTARNPDAGVPMLPSKAAIAVKGRRFTDVLMVDKIPFSRNYD